MSLTAEIVFRGLISFVRESEGKYTRMAALLVNDKDATGFHKHRPRIAWRGDTQPSAPPTPFPLEGRKVSFTWLRDDKELPSDTTTGVERILSFRNYVPDLADFFPEKDEATGAKVRAEVKIRGDCYDLDGTKKELESPVAGEVILTNGKIAATRLVGWAKDNGECPLIPQRVRFRLSDPEAFWNNGRGGLSKDEAPYLVNDYIARDDEGRFIADECVVKMEHPDADALRINISKPDSPLGSRKPDSAFAYSSSNELVILGPFKSGRSEVPPSTVQVLVENFSPMRDNPVPYSIHYRWFFHLLRNHQKKQEDPIVILQHRISRVGKTSKYSKTGAYKLKLDRNGEPTQQMDDEYNFAGLFPYPELADETLYNAEASAGGHEPDNRPICPPSQGGGGPS